MTMIVLFRPHKNGKGAYVCSLGIEWHEYGSKMGYEELAEIPVLPNFWFTQGISVPIPDYARIDAILNNVKGLYGNDYHFCDRTYLRDVYDSMVRHGITGGKKTCEVGV